MECLPNELQQLQRATLTCLFVCVSLFSSVSFGMRLNKTVICHNCHTYLPKYFCCVNKKCKVNSLSFLFVPNSVFPSYLYILAKKMLTFFSPNSYFALDKVLFCPIQTLTFLVLL